jgi:hypothetical protein
MPTELTIPQLRKQAQGHTSHTRGCKKAIDACETCKTVVAWYRELPLQTLSLVLEADRGTPVRG